RGSVGVGTVHFTMAKPANPVAPDDSGLPLTIDQRKALEDAKKKIDELRHAADLLAATADAATPKSVRFAESIRKWEVEARAAKMSMADMKAELAKMEAALDQLLNEEEADRTAATMEKIVAPLAKLKVHYDKYAEATWNFVRATEALLNQAKESGMIKPAKLPDGKDAAEEARKIALEMQAEAHAIQQAADGAVQLAEAFGLVDQRTASTLRSIGQIAADLPGLVDQLSNLGKDSGHTKGTAVLAALPIIGAGANIGANSPSAIGAGLGGAASGAAAGALIGSVVPIIGTAIGAVVGGIGGLVAGLFGHASKIKQLRKEYVETEQHFIDSLQSHSSSYAQQFASIEQVFKDLEAAAAAAKTSVSADARAAKERAEADLRFGFAEDIEHQYRSLQGAA